MNLVEMSNHVMVAGTGGEHDATVQAQHGAPKRQSRSLSTHTRGTADPGGLVGRCRSRSRGHKVVPPRTGRMSHSLRRRFRRGTLWTKGFTDDTSRLTLINDLSPFPWVSVLTAVLLLPSWLSKQFYEAIQNSALKSRGSISYTVC